MSRLTVEDWIAISDHMGDYCWKVDEGDGDGWALLWTEDGVFSGVAPEPIVGREQLRAIPVNAYKDYAEGQMRHLFGNLTCRYGETRDIVKARLYNYVSLWGQLPQSGLFCMALCNITFVRNGNGSGSGWLIKRNDAKLLTL